MKIIWLGQAGLYFESENAKVIVDPYLSDSCGKVNPKSKRRMPVDESFLKLKPDIIVITHEHLDHLDPETLAHYLSTDSGITVLAPCNAWKKLREFGNSHNYVMFNEGTPDCQAKCNTFFKKSLGDKKPRHLRGRLLIKETTASNCS